jgi:hypothetical protein
MRKGETTRGERIRIPTRRGELAEGWRRVTEGWMTRRRRVPRGGRTAALTGH